MEQTKSETTKEPFFSIITVVFNGQEYLEDTINSVLNQSYKNFEYIIIDGGSTDNSVEIIKKYSHQLKYWCSERDSGIFNAMNKGIKLSNGDLIGLLNADDIYLTCALEEVAKVWDYNIDIYFGNMELISSRMKKQIIPDLKKIYRTMSINHPSTFVNKKIYSEFTYNEKYRLSADYDFFLKCRLENKKFKYVPTTLSKMRLGGASSDLLKTSQEVFNIQKKYLGIRIAFMRLTKTFFRALIRFPFKIILTEVQYKLLRGFRHEE